MKDNNSMCTRGIYTTSLTARFRIHLDWYVSHRLELAGPLVTGYPAPEYQLVWGSQCPGHKPGSIPQTKWYRSQEVAWFQPELCKPNSDPSNLQYFVSFKTHINHSLTCEPYLKPLFTHMLKGGEKMKIMK